MFELTYKLTANELEVERERMFAVEQSFSFHEASDQTLAVSTCHLGRNRLCQVRSTGHSISLIETNSITLLLPQRGRIVVEIGSRSFSAGAGDTLLFTPNMRLTHVIPDSTGRFHSNCALVTLDEGSEPTKQQSTKLEACFPSHAAIESMSGLRRYIELLFSETQRKSNGLMRPRARESAGVVLSEMLGFLIEDSQGRVVSSKTPSRHDYRLVDMAEDMMRSRYREPISTRDIATSLGVSARRIQIAFLNVRNANPLGVLKSIRLQIARERLSSSHEIGTITDIASDCGFIHLGRFSLEYAKTFGEKPSQTVRRVRGWCEIVRGDLG